MNHSLSDYLLPSQVHPQFAAKSKKRALEMVASQISDTLQSNEDQAELLVDGLQARERLGSTGIGQGIAVPHCRSGAVSEPSVHLFALEEAIDFDALDGEPVNFLCVLLVPEDANEVHLQLLRDVIRTFGNPECRAPLLAARTPEVLHRTAIDLFERLA